VSASRTIDVHAHYVPASYRAALLDNGHGQPTASPDRTGPPRARCRDGPARDRDVAAVDRHRACTSPTNQRLRDLAREVNEAGRRAVVDHPGRFGLFGSLPLPDVDAAIAEIAHCCARLDVAGFTLLTNIGGTYLGDPAFQPVFRELDRRGARLFIHPTSPACWEHTSLGRPRPMLEFFFDTTRAVVDLVLNGTVARHPRVEFIIPHAGATLPMVADRVSVFSRLLGVDPAVDVLRDLARLHFDLAGFPVPRQLDALLTLTTIEHLHYGSDYPFTTEPAAARASERLAEVGAPPGSVLDAPRQHRSALPRAHRPALTPLIGPCWCVFCASRRSGNESIDGEWPRAADNEGYEAGEIEQDDLVAHRSELRSRRGHREELDRAETIRQVHFKHGRQ
jgi:predicted TIM-barrel fold metal-dependent hydrolase